MIEPGLGGEQAGAQDAIRVEEKWSLGQLTFRHSAISFSLMAPSRMMRQ